MTDTDAKKKRPWNLFGGGGRAHKKSPSSSQKVFGVDLDEVELDDELNIPIVCRDAIERLKETGKKHPPFLPLLPSRVAKWHRFFVVAIH